MSGSNIQVAIKVRPILRKEKEQKQSSNWRVAGNSIQVADGQSDPFYFDHIFDQDVCNQVIFDTLAKQIVDSGLRGFNGTIFAYGQTASGKTYTMMGDEENPGVMVLATKEIFKEIEKATDRQFLLRVGYIEIYNEKIYDLLNKSNQDLKIHETPNGEVSVNCSENIITCAQDLHSWLVLGNKQRKIGETNMNERSSRSHAIFRIIIESRKRDKTDEDSVQISILNLVDLAGSERADQTGATGSRLKEGSHINKSLLFLSCVIKQLVEDKYVSYRDSKLTRILQASLGGNALTAIICTINPTAVDETLSTLSFANRAKVVKNKPQVNEVLTDAAMMKRLEKEINRLQVELKVEKSKNSQIKVDQLQRRLIEENHKIINSSSSYSQKEATEKRRRTWCPSSLTPPVPEENSAKTELYFPQPTMASQIPTKLLLPKGGMNFTPHITLRDVYYQHQFKEIECSPSIDEEFIPAEDVCFDDVLTPRGSPSHPKVDFHTPTKSMNLRTASLTPRLTEKESLHKVEMELMELQAFTNLENKLNVEHDTYNTLKYKLENAERVIARYEKEREDFAFVKNDHLEAQMNLANCQKRFQEIESKVCELEKASQTSKEQISRYEKDITDLKSNITQLEMENREAVSLEFEFQQHKNKSRRREAELLDALEEKQKEINKLERSLQTISIEKLNNSKDDLDQISRSLNESESVCVKCKDLQQILAENKKLALDIEQIGLDCQALQLNFDKVYTEAESAKLRADTLETENDSIKKDADHLKTLHGTLEEVQNQIVSLREEKCKLESVKIEFEVMSKETANKIVEKLNISQEIQTLNTQRDTLAAECDKLLADIAVNGCVGEELNKLRTENSSLHSELQTIKTKLESAQSDYANLKTENLSKSDNYEKLNMEVLSARNQLQILQSEYNEIQQKYEQIQAECKEHMDTIGEIQSEYASIQQKYQSLQREYEKLANDSVQSIADCDRIQTQNESLETEIRELKTKVEEAQRKLLENESLQLELESLKSEMNRLQEAYDKNMSTSPSKDQQKAISKENDKLKHDLENLQQQFNEMQKEYDDISTQLVDNFSDYETLQSEVAKLEAELQQYKGSTVVDNLAEDFKAMKVKTEQLQAENSHLAKENVEWKKTISSMTKAMHEKCNEREELVAQLEDVRNESANKSTDNCEQFISMADSFGEIEIPIGNGSTRTFHAVGASKSAPGNRMIIGNVSGIIRGTFNELRGAIEFTVDELKSGNEIYDSLEIEETSTSANSCDSLEGTTRQPSEAQINELVEEKSRLFERIRDMEEAVATLRIKNEKLKNVQTQLDETQRIVEQLNGDKMYLIAICDENKCKISELNEIISRAECDNRKLIADCEQLKKTVESECAVESVSREVYDEVKRQHEDVCQKLRANENKIAELVSEYDAKCDELRVQLLAIQSKEVTVEQIQEKNAESEKISVSDCKCEEYRREISKLDAMVNTITAQLNKFQENDKDDDANLPVRAELEKTITELHEQLHSVETKQFADLRCDKTEKYEQDICQLLEQLKEQECKCREVQIEIIELKTSLEEKSHESVESAAKFEDLSLRYEKLQAEHDELQSVLDSEQNKSAEMQKTILSFEQLERKLQTSMTCLIEKVATLEVERSDIVQQKEIIEGEYNMISEKLLFVENDNYTLKNAIAELSDLGEKHAKLEHINEELIAEMTKLLHKYTKIEHEKKEIARDNENLMKECHISSSELEKLKEEYEANSREKQDNEQKCEELQQELAKIIGEKTRLQSELEDAKEQLEKLKESQIVERNILQEKCTSLSGELSLLAITKSELQSALEKSKRHSEFLLQQGKDMEEQCSLELCTVRNSNNSMAQQIDELHEKLEKAEGDLKIALHKTNSEKDELIIQLTEKNHSLTAKNSELEGELVRLENTKQSLSAEVTQLSDKNNSLTTRNCELEDNFTLLQQQLEDSKQCLSSADQEKEALQESSSEKDELIAQLSKKNTSLTTRNSELGEKLVILEHQYEESKRCLLNEVHLKEVLEKANTERDDLIVRLTNNNNALATKSSELEEKLAILGNQFEESKRHLSTEVSRLNQLLTEANNLTSTQSSNMEDLTTKITTLSDELKNIQNAAAERDALLQKLNQFQSQYDALAVEHANLELTRTSFEVELNSARAVVVENKTLTLKVSEMQSTLNELQLKCTSMSSANEKLESTNMTLVKQLEDTADQALECKRLNDEIVKLQEELQKSKLEQQNSFDEWISKERTFVEQISQLQKNAANLVSAKKSMQEKLANAETISADKIALLEQQINSLQKEQNTTNMSKSISPKREKTDHLVGENLKVKNMSLMDKLDSCSKSQNEERKNRRLSTHDERRIQSFWDSNRDVSTMTEPTSKECNCSELDQKLNELKQKLLIRDSQVNTLSMELKNHPLKTENATLKKLINEEESKQQKLRQEIKKYKQLNANRTDENRHCAKCAEASKRIFVHSTTQTTDGYDGECYRKLLNKYDELKIICRVRHVKIKELEDAVSTGKENANDNVSSLYNQQYRQKYDILKNKYQILQEKYEEAKILCNMRYEQIRNLPGQSGNS